MKEYNYLGQSKNFHGRNGARVRLFVLHTEEGNQDAFGLHNWMKNAGVSYHYALSNDDVIDIIDTDYCSWSALDANPFTINLVFAGSKAAQSREVWLSKFGQAIDNAAKLFVQDAKKYDPLDPNVLGQDYNAIRSGRSGGIDHSGITYGLGIGDHTDVGKNFPWDVFLAAVIKHRDGVQIPTLPKPEPVNEINKLAATPGFEWLGKRISDGEIPTPAPKQDGRFVQFEAGFIYWHPVTGAYAIPNFLFETYAARGYELGIGFPVSNHGMLTDGEVQTFEDGVLYRKYGKEGVWVHGAIMDQYRRSGYENGPFGWPVADELVLANGDVAQEFERGTFVWSSTGVIALKPKDGPDEIVPIPH